MPAYPPPSVQLAPARGREAAPSSPVAAPPASSRSASPEQASRRRRSKADKAEKAAKGDNSKRETILSGRVPSKEKSSKGYKASRSLFQVELEKVAKLNKSSKPERSVRLEKSAKAPKADRSSRPERGAEEEKPSKGAKVRLKPRGPQQQTRPHSTRGWSRSPEGRAALAAEGELSEDPSTVPGRSRSDGSTVRGQSESPDAAATRSPRKSQSPHRKKAEKERTADRSKPSSKDKVRLKAKDAERAPKEEKPDKGRKRARSPSETGFGDGDDVAADADCDGNPRKRRRKRKKTREATSPEADALSEECPVQAEVAAEDAGTRKERRRHHAQPAVVSVEAASAETLRRPVQLRAVGGEGVFVMVLPEGALTSEAEAWLALAAPAARSLDGESTILGLAGSGSEGGSSASNSRPAVVVSPAILWSVPAPAGATHDGRWTAFDVQLSAGEGQPAATVGATDSVVLNALEEVLGSPAVRWRTLPLETGALVLVHEEDLQVAAVALCRRGHAIGPASRVMPPLPAEDSAALVGNEQYVGAWSLLRREDKTSQSVTEHVAGAGPLRLQSPSGLYVEVAIPDAADETLGHASCAGRHSLMDAGNGRRLSVRHRTVDFQPPNARSNHTQAMLNKDVMGELSHPRGKLKDDFIEAWTRVNAGPVAALELVAELPASGSIGTSRSRNGVWIFCADRFARVIGPQVGDGVVTGACCDSATQLSLFCGAQGMREELTSEYEACWGKVECAGMLRIMKEAWRDDRVGQLFYHAGQGVGGSIAYVQNEVVHHLPSGAVQRWRVRDWGFNPFVGPPPVPASQPAAAGHESDYYDYSSDEETALVVQGGSQPSAAVPVPAAAPASPSSSSQPNTPPTSPSPSPMKVPEKLEKPTRPDKASKVKLIPRSSREASASAERAAGAQGSAAGLHNKRKCSRSRSRKRDKDGGKDRAKLKASSKKEDRARDKEKDKHKEKKAKLKAKEKEKARKDDRKSDRKRARSISEDEGSESDESQSRRRKVHRRRKRREPSPAIATGGAVSAVAVAVQQPQVAAAPVPVQAAAPPPAAHLGPAAVVAQGHPPAAPHAAPAHTAVLSHPSAGHYPGFRQPVGYPPLPFGHFQPFAPPSMGPYGAWAVPPHAAHPAHAALPHAAHAHGGHPPPHHHVGMFHAQPPPPHHQARPPMQQPAPPVQPPPPQQPRQASVGVVAAQVEGAKALVRPPCPEVRSESNGHVSQAARADVLAKDAAERSADAATATAADAAPWVAAAEPVPQAL